MKKPIFTGAGVALVTPFKGIEGSEVNFEKLDEIIEEQIAGGTDAIIICGTTGEASTMPDEEHLGVIKHCIDTVNHRIPVIAGTGSNDTKHAVKLSQAAESFGADGILSVSPYYNKTTQAGLYAHFSAIANAISIPVILYNVPGRTGVNINPETIAELAKIPNVNGIKECKLDQLYDVINLCGDNINIYTGEDGQVFYPTCAGGQGVISVVSNVAPKYMHDMVMAIKNGDIKKGLEMQLNVMELVKAMFCEVNPIPVKEAMNMMGMDVGPVRMPLVPMTEAHVLQMKNALKNFGLLG